MLAVYVTFNVSPLETVLLPPVKAPQEYRTPDVLSMVVTAPEPKTRKHPPTVPLEVIANETAALVALDPAEALDQLGVLRGLV